MAQRGGLGVRGLAGGLQATDGWRHGTAANFGFVLLGVIGYTFAITNDNWRWVFLVGGSPLLIAIIILRWVPESAKWLETKRQPAGAAQSRAPVVEVFRPPLLYRTMLGISLGAIPVVGTAANANWVIPWRDQYESRQSEKVDLAARDGSQPTVKKSKGDPRQKAWTQITRSTGAIFGSLLGGYLASILGRRFAYFMISLLTFGVSSWLFGL